MPPLRAFGAAACACAAAANLATAQPPSQTPAQVGISYDIVACRMPALATESFRRFPDAYNHSLWVGRGTDLVLIHPDGSEEVVFDAGPLRACVDPCVTFDGRAVLFSLFEDPQDFNTQRDVSRRPAHIWRLDLATRIATQLTFGNGPDWQTTAHAVDPLYAAFDLAPLELPDGRILFLSTRDGTFSVTGRFPAPAFWRMNADGSNLERMDGFSQAGCQHPFILRDGRIVWTHRHDAGRRRSETGNYPLMVASSDLSDFKTFAGVHFPNTAWHFGTQLSSGDVVTAVYYHQNNYGHGPLVRFPVSSSHPTGQVFLPIGGTQGPYYYQHYGQNDHFPRLGEFLATPWALSPTSPSINYDESSPLLSDGSRAGKPTMPAGAPGNHLLFVWSSGRVNALHRPQPESPHMAIAFLNDGRSQQRDELVVLKSSAAFHYLYPKPVVPYAAIHGVARPASLPPVANDGAHAMLPAGSPFSTTGTSSLYNRESRWPVTYQDAWDANITNNYALDTAFFHVGQDSYAFADQAIWAAQVVVDMARVDTQYLNFGSDLRSHNHGNQIWGVLGEVPVRKTDVDGNVVRDAQGNPDTSYEVRVPAMTPFHHRIIDRNGLMLTAEWTWHSNRPGERKTNCGGCHAHSIDRTPLDFATTAAARPGYQVLDFALQTPLIDRDTQGNPSLTVRPQKALVVEWFADIKPIVDSKCVSCHTGANPGGGLDLAAPDAWRTLAFEPGSAVQFGAHQATKWVRKHAATQSLLVWKVFGERLDGRTNTDRANDVDYTGAAMPPPGSPQLTFMEQRLFGLWIDLGCLVDLTPGQSTVGDPFDDQMRPTLVVSGLDRHHNDWPLPPLRLGVYDLHSGIAPGSLDVRVTPAGGQPSGNLAAGIAVADGSVITLALPALAAEQLHRVEISVRDLAGNTAHTEIDVVPHALRHQHTGLSRGVTATFSAQGGHRGELAVFVASLSGMGAGVCAAGGTPCLSLLDPLFVLGSAAFDDAGKAAIHLLVPAAVPPLSVFSQVLGVGPAGFRTSRPVVGELH